MNVTPLDNHVQLLTFMPEDKSFIGFNMVLILHGKECILIDTGYKRHFEVIEKYLQKQDLILKQVIISHWHNDHIGGLEKIAKTTPIHGSIFASNTISKYHPDRLIEGPNNVVVDKKTIVFGDNTIEIEINKGHSICGTIITINNRYLFVGDDVIRTYYDQAVIPFCADQDLNQQKSAILNIKKHAVNKVVIPSHGEYLYTAETIFHDLEDRLTYLNFFIENPNATYEAFESNTNILYEGKKWHSYNMRKNT